MVRYEKNWLKDKIYACWLGKNIGGTMGCPYEGKEELQDISGFASEKGAPLPNDDLDLQLVWLCALEERGPGITANDLAEYWVNFIPPHWNEYGVGKSNLKAGIMPPLSGELNNEKWRDSNGAWIRSEIWACLAPGYPEIARHYAFLDACIDHGMGEGTYAEQFTVTLESLAFRGGSIREMIEAALEAIPADCRVAKAVKLVMAGYDAGKDWKTVRQELIEQSKDIGFFQAPANLGYVVLGLLYGEGDFKKSMILAIDCGDDTDCTGATVGAFLGLYYGTAGIPADWLEYVGTDIVTIAVDRSWRPIRWMKNCMDLTDRVIRQIPAILYYLKTDVEIAEGGETVFDALSSQRYWKICPLDDMLDRPRYSYDVDGNAVIAARVEYDGKPVLKEGEELGVTLRFWNRMPDPHHLNIRLILPDGLAATRTKARLYMDHQHPRGDCWQFTLKIDENEELYESPADAAPVSRIIAEVEILGRPQTVYFPILAFRE